MLNPRYAKFVPALSDTPSSGRRANTGTMSGDRELISKSADPLRNSRARTIAFGTTRARNREILGAPPKQSAFAANPPSSSCAWLTKRNGPDPINPRDKFVTAFAGAIPIAGRDTVHKNDAYGSFKRKITVRASGVSIFAIMRNAPRFAEWFVAFKIKSNVAFTSAAVSGLPS